MGMKYAAAQARAIAAGASQARIDQYAGGGYGGPSIKRAMIMALQISSWNNTADEWARLAGALKRKPRKAAA